MTDDLKPGEPHPAAIYALEYLKANITPLDIEALASSAISGSRTAEICFSTWRRLENKEPVSDRYLMGLAWIIKELRDQDAPPKSRT